MTYVSFTTTPQPGYWKDGTWWYGTTGAATTVPVYSYTWPDPQPAAQIGWKCADCGQVMAPWVATHNCATATADAGSAGPAFLAKCSACPPDGQCENCAPGERELPAA